MNVSSFEPETQKCVLLLRASDGARLLDEYKILSISPYAKHANNDNTNKKQESPCTFIIHGRHCDAGFASRCIEYDADKNVYFFDLSGNSYFSMQKYKWTENYTIILWIKWKQGQDSLTTFDSKTNAPIIGYLGKIGCVSNNVPNKYVVTCKKLGKIDSNNWMFVVAVGTYCYDQSKNTEKYNTNFYFGNLKKTPKFEDKIDLSVSGASTDKFGNERQGPGKISFIKVFNFALNDNEILQEYYDSLEQIGNQWNEKEIENIKKIIVDINRKYDIDMINDIVSVIFEYCCKYPFATPTVDK